MAEASLASLKQKRDIVVEWKAYELRPGGKFLGTPEQEAKFRAYIKERQPHTQTYAREHFGVEMQETQWSVNSRPAMEGAFYARAQGKEDEYHKACLQAHWRDFKRLDDLETLVGIAQSVGLEGDGFRAAIKGRAYAAGVETDVSLAREIGLEGVPAFIFGNRYLVSGARPVEMLEQVVDKCIEEGLVESSTPDL